MSTRMFHYKRLQSYLCISYNFTRKNEFKNLYVLYIKETSILGPVPTDVVCTSKGRHQDAQCPSGTLWTSEKRSILFTVVKNRSIIKKREKRENAKILKFNEIYVSIYLFNNLSKSTLVTSPQRLNMLFYKQ